MSDITIHHMRRVRSEDGTVAWFFVDADGWRLHNCRIVRGADGFMKVVGPKMREHGGAQRRAVQAPADVWAAIVEAALDEFANGVPVIDERQALRGEVLRMVG